MVAHAHDQIANIAPPEFTSPAAAFGFVDGLAPPVDVPVGDDVAVPVPLGEDVELPLLKKGNRFVEFASTIIQSFTTAVPFCRLSICSSLQVDVSRV